MIRYFLHQAYEAQQIRDPDGECFLDLADAEAEALISARQIVGNTLISGGRPNFGKIQICDISGTILKEVTFREAIGLRATPAAKSGRRRQRAFH